VNVATVDSVHFVADMSGSALIVEIPAVPSADFEGAIWT
jgi:hypothetical protein